VNPDADRRPTAVSEKGEYRMTDHLQPADIDPEDIGSGTGEAADTGGLTRRQLLVSGAVL
jgi:hypothetical protein